MTEFLYSIDLLVFYFINNTLSNPLFDKIFVYLTEVTNWYLVYVIFWLILFLKGGRIGKIAALLAILLITFSDQLNSFWLKDFFERIRPCRVLPDVNILTGCTSSYSSPSSHAVNNFAIAVFFYRIYPRLKLPLITAALFVSLSRIYVGVHYPSDILLGAMIGYILGYGFSWMGLKINFYFEKHLAGKIASEN